MQFLKFLIDFILHVDKHLADLIAYAGVWSYAALFLVIFAETGLVVMPLLPGDSLLFAIGAMTARGSFDLFAIWALLCVAAILGDTVNYWIGAYVGPKAFRGESRFFKKEYLDRTQAFYERHGGKTIIIARFVPIIRTFAPFVAGIGAMNYRRFIVYNVAGALAWITSFLLLGYYFGNMEVVKRNFTLVIMAIIVISVIPGVVEFIRAKRAGAQAASITAASAGGSPGPRGPARKKPKPRGLTQHRRR